jgi:hypothetical protein
MGGFHGTPEWRFDRHVQKSDGCWLWTGWRNQRGYGAFGVTPDRPMQAHRFAWQMAVGPIPEGLCVLHRCDNPPCVRPDHLFLGTRADNWADAHAKGRDCPPPRMVGERNPAARLTAAEVQAIRRDSRPRRFIESAYGVGKSTVGRIKRGQSWTWLPGGFDE